MLRNLDHIKTIYTSTILTWVGLDLAILEYAEYARTAI